MATLYTHKDSNIRKTWILITAFFVLIIVVGWILSQLFGNPAILVIALIFSVLMGFGSYWWSDKLVLSLTHAKPIQKSDAPELYRIVENLSITAGLPMPRLYILEEASPNAFATGRDPSHAVVAVTRGLLERLDKSELEGVLAHELSHIGNRDILVSTVVVVLAGMFVYGADIMFRSFLWGGFSGGNRKNSGGAMLAIALVVMVIASILATVLKLSISRKREYLADASGALLTRYPEGLASALEKIAADPNKLKVANNATAHLYFENPFKGDRKNGNVNWFNKLFMTHPPVEDRIKALKTKG